MLWLIASYLVMVFLIPLILSGIVSYRSLPSGRRCPQCRGETIPLQQRVLVIAQHYARRTRMEKRWCLECGWEGLTRNAMVRRATAPSSTRTEESARSLPSYRYDAGIAETLDVRTITIDGRSWRVLLQCWNQTQHCYGRLVFVEPTGRLWTDSSEAFRGESRSQVIGQALTVTDGLLTTRLRQILSEA